jgi:hypothetical protein
MAKPRNEWRHLALLSSILFLFVITPVVAAFRHGVLIMNAVAAVVLVAGSYTLSERKRLFAVAVCLSGISIMAAWLVLITQQPWAAILSHSCVIVLIIFFSVTPSPRSRRLRDKFILPSSLPAWSGCTSSTAPCHRKRTEIRHHKPLWKPLRKDARFQKVCQNP